MLVLTKINIDITMTEESRSIQTLQRAGEAESLQQRII